MWRHTAAIGFGALLLLAAAELACQVLPVSTATDSGYYQDPMILNYPAGHRWQVSTGWDLRNPQRMHANNLGFAAEIDFLPNPQAIALIGDSYVEASMLAPEYRPAARLAAHLAAHLGAPPAAYPAADARHAAPGEITPVYALGGPGSALLDYAERMRFAQHRLGLRDFVLLLEPGDIRQSLCGSGNVHAACLDPDTFAPRTETLPAPSTAKRIFRHSALAQFIVGQLKVTPARLVSQSFLDASTSTDKTASKPPADGQEGVGLTASQAALVDAVGRTFFARIEPLDIRRLVIVLDGRRDRTSLAQAPQGPAGVMLERDAFMALAHQHGVVVVDAEIDFRQHWTNSSLSLAVSPQDAHLNTLAVNLLMRRAALALNVNVPH